MKYVIFLRQGRVYIPVIIPEHASHAEVKLEDGGVPVSAGFFHIDRLGNVMVSSRGSQSLKLEPDLARDPGLLSELLEGSGLYAFTKQ